GRCAEHRICGTRPVPGRRPGSDLRGFGGGGRRRRRRRRADCDPDPWPHWLCARGFSRGLVAALPDRRGRPRPAGAVWAHRRACRGRVVAGRDPVRYSLRCLRAVGTVLAGNGTAVHAALDGIVDKQHAALIDDLASFFSYAPEVALSTRKAFVFFVTSWCTGV